MIYGQYRSSIQFQHFFLLRLGFGLSDVRFTAGGPCPPVKEKGDGLHLSPCRASCTSGKVGWRMLDDLSFLFYETYMTALCPACGLKQAGGGGVGGGERDQATGLTFRWLIAVQRCRAAQLHLLELKQVVSHSCAVVFTGIFLYGVASWLIAM